MSSSSTGTCPAGRPPGDLDKVAFRHTVLLDAVLRSKHLILRSVGVLRWGAFRRQAVIGQRTRSRHIWALLRPCLFKVYGAPQVETERRCRCTNPAWHRNKSTSSWYNLSPASHDAKFGVGTTFGPSLLLFAIGSCFHQRWHHAQCLPLRLCISRSRPH